MREGEIGGGRKMKRRGGGREETRERARKEGQDMGIIIIGL